MELPLSPLDELSAVAALDELPPAVLAVVVVVVAVAAELDAASLLPLLSAAMESEDTGPASGPQPVHNSTESTAEKSAYSFIEFHSVESCAGVHRRAVSIVAPDRKELRTVRDHAILVVAPPEIAVVSPFLPRNIRC